MADNITLSTDELEAVLTQLRATLSGPTLEAVLLKAGQVTGIKAEELIGEYPPPTQTLAFRNRRYSRISSTGQPFQSRFKSLAQQRKVFALLRAGQIPYRRTGQLGASAYSKAEVITDGVKVSIGATAPHARYVIGGQEEQALVHKDVWPSLPTLVQDNQALLVDTFAESLKSHLGKVFG